MEGQRDISETFWKLRLERMATCGRKRKKVVSFDFVLEGKGREKEAIGGQLGTFWKKREAHRKLGSFWKKREALFFINIIIFFIF